MLIANYKPVFHARGIQNPYKYLVANGFTYSAAYKLLNNPGSHVNLKHLYKLCVLLQCTPNDIFVCTPDKNAKLPETHPLIALRNNTIIDIDVNAELKTMSLAQIKEVAEVIKQKTRKK